MYLKASFIIKVKFWNYIFLWTGEVKLAHLKLLHKDLTRLKGTQKWDGFLCYLYGIVLRKLDLPHAIQTLQDAVNMNPLNWGAWMELANLVKNSEMVNQYYSSYSY